MNKLCIAAGMTILGYAAWFSADALGLSLWSTFIASGAGSIAGVYVGWKIARHYE